MRVIIGDVNDNAPMFGSHVYSGSVEENVPLGTTVQLVRTREIGRESLLMCDTLYYSNEGHA